MVFFKAKRTSVRHQLLPRPAVVLFCFRCTPAQYVYAPSSPSSASSSFHLHLFLVGGQSGGCLEAARGGCLMQRDRIHHEKSKMLISKH